MKESNWRDKAACRGVDPDLFFILPGQSAEPALRICRSCPVREPCLQAGWNEKFGIWGGYTMQGRSRLIEARRRSA